MPCDGRASKPFLVHTSTSDKLLKPSFLTIIYNINYSKNFNPKKSQQWKYFKCEFSNDQVLEYTLDFLSPLPGDITVEWGDQKELITPLLKR